MKEEKLKKLLGELADVTTEPVRPELAENIKHHIPHRLIPHRSGMDTINIIIDLRIGKLAAAAVIIITTILLASFLGSQDSTDAGIYQESKLLLKYWLGRNDSSENELLAVRSRYEYLAQRGKDVIYYGDRAGPKDSNAVLLQWKLSDGNYRIIFGDLHEGTVSPEELIKLQAQMLQKNAK